MIWLLPLGEDIRPRCYLIAFFRGILLDRNLPALLSQSDKCRMDRVGAPTCLLGQLADGVTARK